MDLTFGVLGPVAVWQDAALLRVPPQSRRLLALLLATEGTASTGVVADALGERAEGSAVRMAVSRLRRCVGSRVVTVDGGYRLEVVHGELDLHRVAELRQQAHGAPPEERAALLAASLDVWRGPAFDGYAEEPWAEAMAVGLDEARANTVEELAAVLLVLQRTSDAIELLEPHIIRHPYRERPLTQLLQAYTEAGRRADAAAAVARHRSRLRAAGLESDGAMDGGVLAFLAADLADATALIMSLGDAWLEVARSYRALVREAVSAHGGRVVRFTDEAGLAVFSRAHEAVEAATALQRMAAVARWPSGVVPSTRLAVHCGPVTIDAEGQYVGLVLRQLDAIATCTAPGQIAVSGAALALATPLTAETRIYNLGLRQLPPLPEPLWLHAVGPARPVGSDGPAQRGVAASRRGR